MTAMQPFHLNPNLRSEEASCLEDGLRQRIIGQDEAIQAVVDLYQVYRAGLNSPGHPLGNLLFLGPTGAGKTRVVEATAEVLFGDPRAVIKVDCAEFQHSHEIAKLIGSPPGYLGHRETRPLINQEALDQHHSDNLKISFLVFDEIEKAADALWQLLLGILDKATLTLGDNRRVDLSNTMIFLTSNLGGREIMQMMSSRMGFAPTETASESPCLDAKIGQTAAAAAKRKFSPEFMNRIDKVVVFHPLQSEQLNQIFDIELRMVQDRVRQTAKTPFRFRVARPAKDFLLREGTDIKYGARHLKRAIEHYLTCPLASLLATEQVRLNDAIIIDWNGTDDGLQFLKEAAGVLSDANSQLPESLAQAAAAGSDGREVPLQMPSQGVAKSAASNGNVGSHHRLTKQRSGASSTIAATNVSTARHIARPRK